MRLPFYKYQGTGNDFVIINQLLVPYLTAPAKELVSRLCDRRFGIGADGLMILDRSDDADFNMIYFNSDGNPSSMCGNGGRCIVHLAHHIKAMGSSCSFYAPDGLHDAKVLRDGRISLQMADVSEIASVGDDFYADTGSPHHVSIRSEWNSSSILGSAKAIRYSDRYKAEGVNVNFIEVVDNCLAVRTYERGVEDETFSCGTGVTAAALVANARLEKFKAHNNIPIKTLGGDLEVSYKRHGAGYKDIWLTGPAELVYEGAIEI